MKKKYYLLLVFYPEGKKLDIVDVDQYLEMKYNFTKLFESNKHNEVIEYYKEYKKHRRNSAQESNIDPRVKNSKEEVY